VLETTRTLDYILVTKQGQLKWSGTAISWCLPTYPSDYSRCLQSASLASQTIRHSPQWGYDVIPGILFHIVGSLCTTFTTGDVSTKHICRCANKISSDIFANLSVLSANVET